MEQKLIRNIEIKKSIVIHSDKFECEERETKVATVRTLLGKRHLKIGEF